MDTSNGATKERPMMEIVAPIKEPMADTPKAVPALPWRAI